MSELTADQKVLIPLYLANGRNADQLTPLMPGATPAEKADQARQVFDCYNSTRDADACLDDLAAGRLGGAGVTLTSAQRDRVKFYLA